MFVFCLLYYYFRKVLNLSYLSKHFALDIIEVVLGMLVFVSFLIILTQRDFFFLAKM
jgi:hypothetical protein